MDFILSFSERLKDLRVKKGLTLKELSEEVGLSVSTLSKYENCTPSEITVDGIMRLAKFYNVSIEYLFGFSENKNHSNTDYSDLHLSDIMVPRFPTTPVQNIVNMVYCKKQQKRSHSHDTKDLYRRVQNETCP